MIPYYWSRIFEIAFDLPYIGNKCEENSLRFAEKVVAKWNAKNLTYPRGICALLD
jgi:hypothetical protein